MNHDDLFMVLQNGIVLKGKPFGYRIKDAVRSGEAVFTTAMTGYIETLTDKSYAGQIIVQSFPLIGNYGVIPSDFEGEKIHASGYVVRDVCDFPSNYRSEGTLDAWLKAQRVVGICGIDTRMLTKIIREQGTMNAFLTHHPDQVVPKNLAAYKLTDAVQSVSVTEKQVFGRANTGYRIALVDYGYKKGILQSLIDKNCRVTVFPFSTKGQEILNGRFDAVVLSNGPGDPLDNGAAISEVAKLMQSKIPLFGICLGHQLMALAAGFATEKLKYGHRGLNQAVRDCATGRVYITSQNHGYAVVSKSVAAACAAVSFVNVNDGTCEGIAYRNLPAFSVQFHPEACAGPHDTAFLFDQLLSMIGGQ